MACPASPRAGRVSLPVVTEPPVDPGPGEIRRSRNGRRRALVLTLVTLAMVAHYLQWRWTGSTVSPVEPSEAAYTVASGDVNTGFFFFLALLVGTFVFGRF